MNRFGQFLGLWEIHNLIEILNGHPIIRLKSIFITKKLVLVVSRRRVVIYVNRFANGVIVNRLIRFEHFLLVVGRSDHWLPALIPLVWHHFLDYRKRSLTLDLYLDVVGGPPALALFLKYSVLVLDGCLEFHLALETFLRYASDRMHLAAIVL